MARTNLHELATRLLKGLSEASNDQTFQGKLRDVATGAGLNSVRTAEAVKLLEELGRIDVVQRGRRGRDTVIRVLDLQPVSIEDAEASLPSRQGRRAGQPTYDEIGRALVSRLMEMARDEGLRAAQVEAFDSQAQQLRSRVAELEHELEAAGEREQGLRLRLRTAEETLVRAEANLRRAMGADRPPGGAPQVADEDARALLDVLKSGRA